MVIAINQHEAHNKGHADCKRQIAILGSEELDNDLQSAFRKDIQYTSQIVLYLEQIGAAIAQSV
jgi:hypothetical protein